MIEISAREHPRLDLQAFTATLAAPQGPYDGTPWTPTELLGLLGDASAAPVDPEHTRRIRDLLRWGGFKPSGRNKPCSEYLARAVPEGRLPRVHLAVDVCNALVYASGIPISVVDLDRLVLPLEVGLGEPGSSYVFNRSGQELALGGLVLLRDAEGPCANAVKDSERTKTREGTSRVLFVLWGSLEAPGQASEAAALGRRALERLGATTSSVRIVPTG